jgi:hypothetical protein
VEKATGFKDEGEEIPLDLFLEGLNNSKPWHKASEVSDISNTDTSRGAHEKNFINRLIENRESEATCEKFALIALCGVYAPRTAYNIDANLLQYVKSVDKMKKINWNRFIYNYMMKAIRKYKNGDYSSLCGCILLLVVSYL